MDERPPAQLLLQPFASCLVLRAHQGLDPSQDGVSEREAEDVVQAQRYVLVRQAKSDMVVNHPGRQVSSEAGFCRAVGFCVKRLPAAAATKPLRTVADDPPLDA